MCGDKYCSRKCRLCIDFYCTKVCDRVRDHECTKYQKPPFVCSTCSEKNKKKCIYDKYYYIAEKADAKAKATRSESWEVYGRTSGSIGGWDGYSPWPKDERAGSINNNV